WFQWLLFGSLSLITMLAFRDRLYKKLRGNIPDYVDGPAGELIRIDEPLAAGATCRQEYRGTSWTVINRSLNDIDANTEVKIAEVSGLDLIIK
ncbi:MAG: NfeD family protein, partial [Gammaproteobacteria bacterium]|nr:NfeD family protein [Gammaproteobacteria bacterium]